MGKCTFTLLAREASPQIRGGEGPSSIISTEAAIGGQVVMVRLAE
jgi:hypothetical protein